MPFSKNNKTQTNKSANHKTRFAWPRPGTKKGAQPKKPQRPTKRSTAVPLGQISVSLEDGAPHRRIPTSLEGLAPPRVSLYLARGLPPLGRVSASLEDVLDARRCTYSPDQSIKCSGTPRVSVWNVVPTLTSNKC
jgi:hypothetical protein